MKKKYRILLLVLPGLGSSGLYFWAEKIDMETFIATIIALLAMSPLRIFGYRDLGKEVRKLEKEQRETKLRYLSKEREYESKHDSIAQELELLEDSAMLIRREIDSPDSENRKSPYTEEQILKHLHKYK